MIFKKLFKYSLQFFGCELFVIFWQSEGQRLPGAAMVWTSDPQIPSLMPWPLLICFISNFDILLDKNKPVISLRPLLDSLVDFL